MRGACSLPDGRGFPVRRPQRRQAGRGGRAGPGRRVHSGLVAGLWVPAGTVIPEPAAGGLGGPGRRGPSGGGEVEAVLPVLVPVRL